uniref:Uncharacterized protein n=1 Tax=Oryza glumipatula TaxID=40148 RepID=A0A0E0A9N8_9ORYZ
MLGSGMPWPGDEGDQRWEQAWMAIKKEDEVVLDYTTDPLITDQGSKNQSSRALHGLVMPLRISMGHHRAQDVEGAVKEGKL